MGFKRKELHAFGQWSGDVRFDPNKDRLLVTTTEGSSFVARSAPDNQDGDRFIMDREFLPANLHTMVIELPRFHAAPAGWHPFNFPWQINLYDAGLTYHGSTIEMLAIGPGWVRPVRTRLIIESIKPVLVDAVDPNMLTRMLDGVYFGEPEFNIDVILELLSPA